MKRKMLRLFHSFKRANTAANWEVYRQARNEYQYALDKAEVDYKTSLTDSLYNSKNSKFLSMNLCVFQQKPNVLSPLQIIGLLPITVTPNFSSFLKPAHYM